MAISPVIVEDGTNVAGANSWVGVDDVRTYAENRGIILDVDDDVVTTQIYTAMDYLVSIYRARWKGTKTETSQTLPWPRMNVYIDGLLFDEHTIPAELIAAECQLVLAIKAGAILQPTGPGGVLPVIREKVDVLETEYASPQALGGADWQSPQLGAVEALLGPLLVTAGRLRTLRI